MSLSFGPTWMRKAPTADASAPGPGSAPPTTATRENPWSTSTAVSSTANSPSRGSGTGSTPLASPSKYSASGTSAPPWSRAAGTGNGIAGGTVPREREPREPREPRGEKFDREPRGERPDREHSSSFSSSHGPLPVPVLNTGLPPPAAALLANGSALKTHDGKGRRYSKEFLIGLYHRARQAPEGMENMEVIWNEQQSETEARMSSDPSRRFQGRTDSFGRSGPRAIGRNPTDEDGFRRRDPADLWDTPTTTGAFSSDGSFRATAGGGGSSSYGARGGDSLSGSAEQAAAPWAKLRSSGGDVGKASGTSAPEDRLSSSVESIDPTPAPPSSSLLASDPIDSRLALGNLDPVIGTTSEDMFGRIPLPSGVGNSFLSSGVAMQRPSALADLDPAFGRANSFHGLGTPATQLDNLVGMRTAASMQFGLGAGGDAFGVRPGLGFGQAPVVPQVPPQVQVRVEPPKWVYRDPHGQIQGPFSHLEMQEWYSNGYFTLDLPIKHVDAPTFEPLARFLARYGEISPFKDEAEEYVQRQMQAQRAALAAQQQDPFNPFGGVLGATPGPAAGQSLLGGPATGLGALNTNPSVARPWPDAPLSAPAQAQPQGWTGQQVRPQLPAALTPQALQELTALAASGALPPQAVVLLLQQLQQQQQQLMGAQILPEQKQQQVQPAVQPPRPIGSPASEQQVVEAAEAGFAPFGGETEQAAGEPQVEEEVQQEYVAEAEPEPVVEAAEQDQDVESGADGKAETADKKDKKAKKKAAAAASSTENQSVGVSNKQAVEDASKKGPWEGKSGSSAPSLREIQEMEEREREKQRKKQEAASKNMLASEIARAQAEQEAAAKIQQATAAWTAPKTTSTKGLSLSEIMAEEERRERERKAKLEAQRAAIAQSAPAVAETWGSTRRFADAVATAGSSSPAPAWGGMKPMSVPAGLPIRPPPALAAPTARPPVAASGAVAAVSASPVAASPAAENAQDWHTVGHRTGHSPTMARSGTSPAPMPTRSPGIKEKGPSEEFMKWCRSALRSVVASGPVNADDFVSMLLSFPMSDTATITMVCEDTLGFTTAIDPRKFAAEFISRRKADAGIASTPSKTTGLEGFETPNAFVTVKNQGKKGKKK